MAKRKAPPEEDFCSFCYKSSVEVRLLRGPAGINICDECIHLCSDILNSEKLSNDDKGKKRSSLPVARKQFSPKSIHEQLDEYIIGHDNVKKILSVAVFTHYQRVFHNQNNKSDIELEKSNILLIGDTGTGKTLLAKTLAKIVDVPFAVADATTLTEAGYVGEDVENILLKLIQAAGGEISRAEKGIIFIDEVDKISRKSENRSITRDVSGEGVQQALLKILEGTVASVPPQGGRKHPEQQNLKIDTSNILFICGGAFDGLEQIIDRRLGGRRVGFAHGEDLEKKKEETLRQVEPDDLIKYGIIPELVGRMPVACVLDKLDQEAYFRILQEPKNSLVRQYLQQYKIMGTELTLNDDFLYRIVEESYEKKLGVRALRSTMEKYLTPLTYEVASSKKKIKKLQVDVDIVKLGVEKYLEKQMSSRSRTSTQEKLDEAG